MPIKRGWILAVTMAMLAVSSWAQGPARYTIFGGALLGSSSGFAGGAGLTFGLTHNVSFDPTLAVGRRGHQGLLTVDGVFQYEFHPDDEAIIPYILGGVGLAEWGSATHGSAIAGIGARFPIHHNTWIVPEIRAGEHGLARFTIGISKTF